MFFYLPALQPFQNSRKSSQQSYKEKGRFLNNLTVAV